MNVEWLIYNRSPALNIDLLPAAYPFAVALAVLVFVVLVQNWDAFTSFDRRRWGIFAACLIAAPLLSGVLIIHFNAASTLGSAWLPLLGYLPLAVAALWLGLSPALVIGLVTGLTWALFVTARLTQPFEIALVGAAAAASLNQRYRGSLADALRRPLAALPLVVVLIGWPLELLAIFITGPASTLANLDQTAALILPVLLSNLGVALIAAGVLEIALLIRPGWHPAVGADRHPAPWAVHLSQRIIITFVPGALLSISLLVGVVTITSYRAASSLVTAQMLRDADTAGSQTLFFVQIGRSLIRDLARNTDLMTGDPADRRSRLEEGVQSVPFFSQLVVVDTSGQTLGAYPALTTGDAITADEASRIDFALDGGVPTEIARFTEPGNAVGMSFIASIEDPATGQIIGALVGRTNLDTNPILEPATTLLRQSFVESGEGFLVDDQNRILLYPARPDRQQQTASFEDLRSLRSPDGSTFRQREPDGTRRLIVIRPIQGHSDWSVVLVVPNEVVLGRALQIALPTLLLLLILTAVALPLILALVRRIGEPLEALAGAADRIAEGQLDNPLGVSGEDEVGRLGRAFEEMRVRLERRLTEQDRLLNVSRSVSANLELFRAMPPILGSAADLTDAAGVRVVLRRAADQPLQTYATGDAATGMAPLDSQLFDLVEREGTVVISQFWRASGSLDASGLSDPLGSLVAFPLRSDTHFHGVMWLGFKEEHVFEQSEMTFLSTLAGQAAVAAANARLFAEADEGRRKLEAVLESTADGMIVVDNEGRVTLINPAAEEYLNLRAEQTIGQRAIDVIPDPQLASLMTDLQEPVASLEMPQETGATLLAACSTIVGHDGAISGRVAILRDITPLKELDNLKTVFLRMVSHDLRSPLTYMRGFASMLPLSGSLNQKQNEALKRINDGVEHISQMTERLTYLSRLTFGEEAELDYNLADMKDLLDEVVTRHTPAAEDRKINLSVEVQPDLPLVLLDGMLYGQAVQNLVQNALKYTPENGRVQLRAYIEDGGAGLTTCVSDTGMGIRPEDQVRLFEAFYRVPHREGDPPRPKGSGIGLALVKAIAQAHGGTVRLESEWEKGSTFFITIPVRQAKDLNRP